MAQPFKKRLAKNNIVLLPAFLSKKSCLCGLAGKRPTHKNFLEKSFIKNLGYRKIGSANLPRGKAFLGKRLAKNPAKKIACPRRLARLRTIPSQKLFGKKFYQKSKARYKPGFESQRGQNSFKNWLLGWVLLFGSVEIG